MFALFKLGTTLSVLRFNVIFKILVIGKALSIISVFVACLIPIEWCAVNGTKGVM